MKTQDPSREVTNLETDADEFAEEVRYAVHHHGEELHPEQNSGVRGDQQQGDRTADMPWQID